MEIINRPSESQNLPGEKRWDEKHNIRIPGLSRHRTDSSVPSDTWFLRYGQGIAYKRPKSRSSCWWSRAIALLSEASAERAPRRNSSCNGYILDLLSHSPSLNHISHYIVILNFCPNSLLIIDRLKCFSPVDPNVSIAKNSPSSIFVCSPPLTMGTDFPACIWYLPMLCPFKFLILLTAISASLT